MRIKLFLLVWFIPLTFVLSAEENPKCSLAYPQNDNVFHSEKSVSKKNDSDRYIFGYLPSWIYYENNYNIRYDLLTHLCVFAFEADSLGNLSLPEYTPWPWDDVLQNADQNDVKKIFAVTSLTEKDINKLLVNPDVRKNLFENILGIIEQYEMDGVNIDFEDMGDNENGRSYFKNFMLLLNQELKLVNQNLELSVALPSINSRNWDFQGIAEHCDYIFIMGYDYYGSWSSTTGPTAPLTGQFFYLQNDIDVYYENIPTEKLILGVPYYGNVWNSNSGEPYAKVLPFDEEEDVNNWQNFVLYKELTEKYSDYEKMFDYVSSTTWFRKKINDTTWSQIWCDDPESIELKYDLALQKQLRGVGIWALGYDALANELWDLIENKFYNSTSAKNSGFIAHDFYLDQNYPNPFNPSTIINYEINYPGIVTLKIYDMLGREVKTILNEFQNSGSYSITLEAEGSALSSGVYYYVLSNAQNSIAKKMIYVK